MAIANKSVIWGLFAAGGTLTAFVFPALIALFLVIATGNVPKVCNLNNFTLLRRVGLAKHAYSSYSFCHCGMQRIACGSWPMILG